MGGAWGGVLGLSLERNREIVGVIKSILGIQIELACYTHEHECTQHKMRDPEN